MGEVQLDLWVTEIDGQSHSPKADRNGWDRYVEIPLDQIDQSECTLDKRRQLQRVFVQVKSFTNGKTKESVALSVLDNLVKTPDPAFFLFMDYSKDKKLKNAFLVHVYGKLMRDILERLRKESFEGSKPTHKLKKTIKFSQEDALPELSGEGLKQAILQHVGNPNDYAQRKINLLNKLGYEDSSVKVSTTLRLPEKDADKGLINMFLGIKGMPIAEASFTDVRFGIPASKPDHELKGGTFHVKPPEFKATVQITLPSSFERVTWDGSLTTTQPLADVKGLDRTLTEQFFLRSHFFDLQGRTDGKNVVFTFPTLDMAQRYSLGDFSRLLKTLEIFNKGDLVEMTIFPKGRSEQKSDKPVASFPPTPFRCTGLFKDLKLITKVFTEAKIESSFYFSLDSILEYRDKLLLMYFLLLPVQVDKQIQIFIDEYDPPNEGESCSIILPTYLDVEEKTIVIVSMVSGTVSEPKEVGEGIFEFRMHGRLEGASKVLLMDKTELTDNKLLEICQIAEKMYKPKHPLKRLKSDAIRKINENVSLCRESIEIIRNNDDLYNS